MVWLNIFKFIIKSNCQRQFKTDPLIGNIANLKLTHPGRLSIG